MPDYSRPNISFPMLSLVALITSFGRECSPAWSGSLHPTVRSRDCFWLLHLSLACSRVLDARYHLQSTCQSSPKLSKKNLRLSKCLIRKCLRIREIFWGVLGMGWQSITGRRFLPIRLEWCL